MINSLITSSAIKAYVWWLGWRGDTVGAKSFQQRKLFDTNSDMNIGTDQPICRTEGISALYEGFSPKALRMGIGGAVAVTAFEAVCEIAHSFE